MRKTALQRAIGNLEKRIERLEELNPEPALIPGLVWVESLDQEQKDAMTPDQRIVEDLYEDEESRVVMVRERITKDPGDVGKVFPNGSWERSQLPRPYGPPERVVPKVGRLHAQS